MDREPSILRLLAHLSGRSVLRRATAAMSRSLPAIGVAPIQVAGDRRLQALAVGPLDWFPTIDVLPDPLQRTPADFADVSARIAALLGDGPVQFWLPDRATLRSCGLEGIRNRRNPDVSPERQFLARWCYALFRMEEQPGQQIVAVATQVLANHLTTGQSPTEDAHLRARLAWDRPIPGISPASVSADRRETGGPAFLELENDERAENIRARAFQGTATPAELGELYGMLGNGALRSWEVLTEAYDVYRNLAIPDLPGLEALVRQSAKDFAWYLKVSPAFGASRSYSVEEFRRRERQLAVFEDLNARGDRMERERLRREGRVIRATVLKGARPRRRGHGSCRLLLSSTQETLRFRVGTKLKTEDNTIEGLVDAIRYTADAVLFTLLITRGKTQARRIDPGNERDWFDTVVFPFRRRARQGKSRATP